ncbi:MAG: acyl carrier protein [Deltaproteobacteria bacterium]|nr:acyl carrier protein [Deltaproteobacteria bacterium]
MQPKKLEEEILAALIEVAPEIDTAGLVPEKNFRDQYPLDSIDFLHFILQLEKRLACKIRESDYPKLSSLKGAVNYLELVQKEL